jgi:hypothetical protein
MKKQGGGMPPGPHWGDGFGGGEGIDQDLPRPSPDPGSSAESVGIPEGDSPNRGAMAITGGLRGVEDD